MLMGVEIILITAAEGQTEVARQVLLSGILTLDAPEINQWVQQHEGWVSSDSLS